MGCIAVLLLRMTAAVAAAVAFFAGLAAVGAPASAQAITVSERLTHPDGATILVKTITPRPDSIVMAATIANPADRDIRLDRSRSFVLDDDARGVHALNPPLDNPELRIAARSVANAELVFIGPLPPSVRRLTLSANQGIGTTDNPYDDTPAFRAVLPLAGASNGGGYVGEHPDGAALRVARIVSENGACVASLGATNGNDRTIVLNQADSMTLTDDHGAQAAVQAPDGNGELVVPAGSRLDAELVFDCRRLDTASGQLTLSTNRGTAGTTDNPYETLPVLAFRVAVEAASGATPMAPQSHAAVAAIARSVLTAAAAAPPSAATAGPALAATPAAAAPAASANGKPAAEPAPATKPQTPPPPAPTAGPSTTPTTAAPPAPPPPPSPAPSQAAPAAAPSVPSAAAAAAPPKETPRTTPELEAALHATRGFRGIDISLSADTLFGEKGSALDAGATPLLADVAALIAATHAKQVTIAGNTDSAGSDADNMALSKARAQAVAAWLGAKLTKHPPKIAAEGYGRTRPVAPNHKADGSDNPEGRAQNRRIDITLSR